MTLPAAPVGDSAETCGVPTRAARAPSANPSSGSVRHAAGVEAVSASAGPRRGVTFRGGGTICTTSNLGACTLDVPAAASVVVTESDPPTGTTPVVNPIAVALDAVVGGSALFVNVAVGPSPSPSPSPSTSPSPSSSPSPSPKPSTSVSSLPGTGTGDPPRDSNPWMWIAIMSAVLASVAGYGVTQKNRTRRLRAAPRRP